MLRRLGLVSVTDQAVTVGFRPGRKLATLVHTLVAGATASGEAHVSRRLDVKRLTALRDALEAVLEGTER